MRAHLKDDDLLDQLYGLADHAGHLETCDDCERRWTALLARRAALTAPEDPGSEFLAGQRRRIYARLGERPGPAWRWVPATVALAVTLLAAGVFLHRPAVAPRVEVVDSQLYSDVYSMEEATEPRAAAPIHALVEENEQ